MNAEHKALVKKLRGFWAAESAKEAAAAIESLSEQVERLEKALRPFAKSTNFEISQTVTAADYDRARKALGGQDD